MANTIMVATPTLCSISKEKDNFQLKQVQNITNLHLLLLREGVGKPCIAG